MTLTSHSLRWQVPAYPVRGGRCCCRARKLRLALLALVVFLGRPRCDRRGRCPNAGRFLRRPELPLGGRSHCQPRGGAEGERLDHPRPRRLVDDRPDEAQESPLNGNDPAYHLSDLDALVELGAAVRPPGAADDRGDAQVGKRRPDPEPPADEQLSDLTSFAQMLASRYNGTHAGFGRRLPLLGLERAEPAAVPDPAVRGQHDRQPEHLREALHGRLQGDQGRATRRRSSRPGRPRTAAQPAPSAREATRSRRRRSPSCSRSRPRISRSTPGPRIRTRASYALGPDQKVAYPNVGFSTMTKFGASLQKWFHRRVPIWVTEYAEQTTPE